MVTRKKTQRRLRRRWSDRYVGVSLGAEYFFANLFGKRRSHRLAGWMKIAIWRRECHRLVTALQNYIQANVVTDRNHQSEIDNALRSLHRSIDGPVADREANMVTDLLGTLSPTHRGPPLTIGIAV